MIKRFLLASLLLSGACVHAQTYKLTVGEEMKMRKGTTDMKIVAADKSGVYFTEGHLVMKSYFVIGASYGTSQKLIKFDKNFSEVYTKEYKKELKGYEFHSFQTVGDDLFLIATDYIKKEKVFKVFGVKIDKNSGDFIGELNEIGSFDLENKRDHYELKVEQINNGKNLLAAVDISNTDRTSIGISILDGQLNKKENTVINLTYNPNQYKLQDIKYTSSKKIVLLGKEFEETQVGKRKRKKLVFTKYAMAIYNNKGKKEKEVSPSLQDKFVIGGNLIEEPTGEILLAGFYSNTAKKEDLNGFFLNKLDVVKGELLTDSYKEINTSMLGTIVDDDDKGEDADEKKAKDKRTAKEKEDDDEDAFPNSYIIRSVAINPVDGSYVITAEISQYSFHTYTTSQYNSMSKTWNYTTHTVHSFTNSNILVINADKDAKIKWMNSIPKRQVEEIHSSGGMGGGVSFYTDFTGYFARSGGMPYYSSYTSLINKNNLIIILNDHKDNNAIANYDDKVKTVYNFRKRSNTYGIAIDLTTGKMTRKYIAANDEDLVMMPRHAYLVNNELYIPTWKQRTMAKTEFKMTKIAVN